MAILEGEVLELLYAYGVIILPNCENEIVAHQPFELIRFDLNLRARHQRIYLVFFYSKVAANVLASIQFVSVRIYLGIVLYYDEVSWLLPL